MDNQYPTVPDDGQWPVDPMSTSQYPGFAPAPNYAPPSWNAGPAATSATNSYAQAHLSASSPAPFAPPTSEPVVPAHAAPTPRKKRMAPTIVAVAMLSAGIGGGAAVGANYYSNQNQGAAPSPQATVTQVVQASSNAPDWTVTADLVSKSSASIEVSSRRGSAAGSGVVLDKEGHIVTNYHVAMALGIDADISVALGDETYSARIIGYDQASDLAVLQLQNPPADLTPITFANSVEVVVGEPVMAIGNPLGLSGTVTTGIVSALHRPVRTSSESALTNAIQTSAAINPGNSGGALVNAEGQLIGINTAIATVNSSSESGNIGIGFAIEANQVKSMTDQIIATGS